MSSEGVASNEEVNWEELEMPPAPETGKVRRFYSDWPMEKIVRSGFSFALFAAGLLLTVWAVGLFEESFLNPHDPALRSSMSDFEDLTGFDEVSTDGDGVAVCIVDSGIDMSHPDLASFSLSGWSDFINARDTPYDDEGHGTAMAGILIADGYISGIAKGVNLYIAKAITKEGTGTDDGIAEAVDWCVEQSVDIISLSLGGSQGIDFIVIEGDSLEGAVNAAIDEGIFVVAAAGNDGEDDDGDVASPGSVENVICVGAIDKEGNIWSGSSAGDNSFNPPINWVPRSNPDKKPELVAPGEDIPVLNAQIGGTDALYAWGDGTSGATVWVTGALAHLLEERPDLQHDGASGGSGTVEDVKSWIMDSVVPKDGQGEHDNHYGYGHLKVDALIQQAGQA
ncbi:MAG: S8 family serine peptidase [Candidatus Thermoplasmatota archaeon]|nr:S8 family serine peptidase [Candidatus Thermoplasmatota archaeon]